MINEDNLHYIQKFANEREASLVVFVGDKYQLPPLNIEDGKITSNELSKSFNLPKTELKHIHRTKNTDIYNIYSIFREYVLTEDKNILYNNLYCIMRKQLNNVKFYKYENNLYETHLLYYLQSTFQVFHKNHCLGRSWQ